MKMRKKTQAGHFIPGRKNAILFDDRGCHVQCYHCNVGLKGNPRKYDEFMRKKYGTEVIKELEELNDRERKFTIVELQEMIEDFKSKIKLQ